jgi:hypothetical protein
MIDRGTGRALEMREVRLCRLTQQMIHITLPCHDQVPRMMIKAYINLNSRSSQANGDLLLRAKILVTCLATDGHSTVTRHDRESCIPQVFMVLNKL